jgi:SPP1 gp7 family putative phage head morphogenesis protein
MSSNMADAANAMTGLRTATNTAYNEARDSLFQRSDDVTGYLFSAVLDDVTTELCRSLDGRMWKKDDSEWIIYQPPLHYNCRSILTPVMRGDEPAEWDTPPVGATPAEGFGGPAGARVHPAGSIEHPTYS